MERVQPEAVFTPGSFPSYTYVERDNAAAEEQLRKALRSPGTIVSLSGPSKSGKTVLVERVVGANNLIPVTGGSIWDRGDLWERTLLWMGVPSSIATSKETSHRGSLTADATAGLALFGIGRGEASGGGTIESGRASSQVATRQQGGMAQVVKEIGGSEFVLLLDDFHYVERSRRLEVANEIKEAARLGVKIVIASVPHRSDDVIRANPDLRGRVSSLDLAYWKPEELARIPQLGFQILSAELDAATISSFVAEAAGSPQLMQAICLNACWELGLDSKGRQGRIRLDTPARERIYRRTSVSTDYRTLVGRLQRGPKTRGTERANYSLATGGEGDVYACILRAVAMDPPQLSFSYDDVIARVEKVCSKASKPVGSSITGSLTHMGKIASESPGMPVLEWDEEKGVLELPDPYLLFYLRWSGC